MNTSKPYTDADIVGLYLARDESAVEVTERIYGGYCLSVAMNILNNLSDAEECVNDTYLRAWNSIPPHEPRSYLYAYLARITRHISLNCSRDRSRLKRSAFISELSAEMEQCIPAADDVACHIDDMELRDAINGFLSKLDEEKRNIFIRRYWYLDSVAAISKRFALSESKVKTTLFRCRTRLREHLEKEGYTL